MKNLKTVLCRACQPGSSAASSSVPGQAGGDYWTMSHLDKQHSNTENERCRFVRWGVRYLGQGCQTGLFAMMERILYAVQFGRRKPPVAPAHLKCSQVTEELNF